MLREVKEFFVDPVGDKPSLDDCYEAVDIALKYNCFVRMIWYIKHSGKYSTMVDTTSNAKEVYDSLPKVYGV